MTTTYSVVPLQEKITKLREPGYFIMGSKLTPSVSQGYIVCWYFTAVTLSDYSGTVSLQPQPTD